jgi:hypothetical protein
MLGYPSYANAGVCLHEGEADLLPGAPITPLVFSSTGDNSVAAQLQPGDALVAIDGAAVNEWVAAAKHAWSTLPSPCHQLLCGEAERFLRALPTPGRRSPAIGDEIEVAK